MELSKLLSAIRALYVVQFTRTLGEMAQDGRRVLSEVVLRDEDGEPARDGALDLPMRIDAVPLDDGAPGEVVSIDSTQRLKFAPAHLRWADRVSVEIHPFSWDAVEVELQGETPPSWEPLATWFARWFRQDDDGEGEPIEVIHFVSEPTPESAGHRLALDLGTAPPDALEELLLEVSLALGAERVIVGAPSRSDAPD